MGYYHPAMTDETKAKIAAAKRGFTHTDETKAKIAAALTGRSQTPEHVEKRAAKTRGRPCGHSFRRRMKAIADARHHLQGIGRIPPPVHMRDPGDTFRTYRPYLAASPAAGVITLTGDEWHSLSEMLESVSKDTLVDGDKFHELAITFPYSSGAVFWGWKLFRSKTAGYASPGNNSGKLNLGGVWMSMEQGAVKILRPDKPPIWVSCFVSPFNLHPHDRTRTELVTGKTIPSWYTLNP